MSPGVYKIPIAVSLSILGTVIPMLEVALDGALLKFLLEEVDDGGRVLGDHPAQDRALRR